VQNPLKVVSKAGYQRTGAFFFRDLRKWRFQKLSMSSDDKFHNLRFFEGRKKWLKSLFPCKLQFFPPEWDYIFEDAAPTRSVPEALMEAGAVYMDRRRHEDTLDAVFRSNRDFGETYRDKETWWIACCMVGKEFTMNKAPAMKVWRMKMTQFYDHLSSSRSKFKLAS
jgi:hypothetical protein